jgi:hypothetical protein
MGWLFDSAISWFTAQLLDVLTTLWNLLLQTALITPDVTGLPQVQEFRARSLTVVNTCFGLVIVGAGIVVMSRETLQTRYGLSELAPRVVVGFVAANMSTVVCGQLVAVANALTRALAGDDIASAGSFGQLRNTVQSGLSNGPVALLAFAFAAILAVLTALLMAQWLVRLGVLIVLVGIAPIALACHALPFTDAAARLWWRATLGTVGTVVLQAVALHVALSIFLDPAANVAPLGIPDDPTQTLNLFIVVCLLWAIIKIPGLVRRYVTKGTVSAGASIGRFVIVQQLTRSLIRALPRGPAGTVGRGRGRGGAGGGRIGGGPPRPGPSGGGGTTPHRPAGPRPRPTSFQRDRMPSATARPGVRPYTADQIRRGVDVYSPVARRRATQPFRNPVSGRAIDTASPGNAARRTP